MLKIGYARVCLYRGDQEKALEVLNTISSSEGMMFMDAIRLKSHIYLHHYHDKGRYIQELTRLTEKLKEGEEDVIASPSSNYLSSLVMLGDGYLAIHDPENACRMYEDVLYFDSSNLPLIKKTGSALMATHDYRRALDFYESSLQVPLIASSTKHQITLRVHMASLYLKLHELDNAIHILVNIPPSETLEDETEAMESNVQMNLLLATIYERKAAEHLSIHRTDESKEHTGRKEGYEDEERKRNERGNFAAFHQASQERNYDSILDYLMRAKDLQRDILRKATSDSLTKQKRQMAQICYRIGEFHTSFSKQSTLALNEFKESVSQDDSFVKGRIAMVDCFLNLQEVDRALEEVVSILQLSETDPAFESTPHYSKALLLKADLLLMKNEKETLAEELTAYLQGHPTDYIILFKCIYILKRLGKLNECEGLLERAAEQDPKASCGLHVCKGLFQRYMNDERGAILSFNKARKDGFWSGVAIKEMASLYLASSFDRVWEDGFEEGKQEEDRVSRTQEEQNMRVALRLVSELQRAKFNMLFTLWDKQIITFKAYILSKEPSLMQKAEDALKSIVEENRDFVPGILLLATLYMIQENGTKARNSLKTIKGKKNFNERWSWEFITSYLLLAKSNVHKGKYDLAEDICKECLRLDSSSVEAWEVLGLIYEKERSFVDAAESYEKAWTLSYYRSPTLGFKLAFNYLKAERYVEAIQVSEKILKEFPNHPTVQTEILNRAWESIRP
jgi:tetratricopeptide repeat protein 21B